MFFKMGTPGMPHSTWKTSLLTKHVTRQTIRQLKVVFSAFAQENGSPWKTIDDFCHLTSLPHDKTLKKENTLDSLKLMLVWDC